MALTLHAHLLSRSCWKALIALHEAGLDFGAPLHDIGDPGVSGRFRAPWPLGKGAR